MKKALLNYSIVLASALVLLLAGCNSIQNGYSPFLRQSQLDQWILKKAVPYIEKELTSNPKFKNATVQLVHVEGEIVSSETNALSGQLLSKLASALQNNAPKVNLAMRPASFTQQQLILTANCGNMTPVTHLIGLDLEAVGLHEFKITLRAQSLHEKQWINEFENSWTGSLTAEEQHSVKISYSDRNTLGLSQLPYAADQADLMANYFAHNISCLVKQSHPEHLSLFINPPPRYAPAYFTAINSHIESYLKQYMDIEISKSAKDANAIIDSNMSLVSGELWQLWIRIKMVDDNQLISGAKTPTFVKLNPSLLTSFKP